MFKLNTNSNQSSVPKVWIILSFLFLVFLSYSTYDFVLIDEEEAKILSLQKSKDQPKPAQTNIFGQPINEGDSLDNAQREENKMLAIGYGSAVFTIGLILIAFTTFKLRPKELSEEDTTYQED